MNAKIYTSKVSAVMKIISFLLMLTVSSTPLFGQLTGIKTIPGDYASLTLAVTDLNTQGVGAGGVTFNIAAGYTESITAAIFLTATGTAANPIMFQKSGAGANPLITRTDGGTLATSVLGGQGDAVILIQGSDYVTFVAIDVAASDHGIEYGYFLRKTNSDDGCKFVAIRNCTVTMTKGTSAFVAGIYSSNLDPASTTGSAVGVTVTSIAGRNEGVQIIGNTISNVFTGIHLRGFNHTTAPFGFYDHDFVVGAMGAGNIIQNFGGNAASTTYGIYMIYHNNLSIGYNTINNTAGGGSGFTATGYGIFTSTATSVNISITNNLVTLTSAGTTTLMHGINNAAGSTAAGNTVTIAHNTVTGCAYPTATTAAFTGIVNTGTAATVNVHNNTVSNNVLPGTGTFTGIDGGGGSTSTVNMFNNTVNNNQKTGASGSFFNLRCAGGTVTVNNNNIYDNAFTAASGTASCIMYGYYNLGVPPFENVYNNNIYNLSVSGTNTATASLLSGMHTHTTGTAAKNIYNNNIYNLSALSGSVNGIVQLLGADVRIYKNNIYNLTNNTNVTTTARTNGIVVSSGNTYVFNNFISELKAPLAEGDDAVRGISITSTAVTTTVGLYYNTIYLNAMSAGVNFGSTGVFHTYSATATTAALDMRNNVIVNNSTHAGTGRTVALRRSAATDLNNYSTLSNNNDFFAGVPGANNLIFFDGTNADQTIGAFKTRVAPRESASFTENPPFVNVTTSPYNLRMQTTIPTQVESGGIPISSPFAITDDFDGDVRNATTPDLGADEFSGLPQDLTPPIISYTPLLNTGSTAPRTLTTNITDLSGVPTAGIGLPMLYWRKGADPYVGVQAVHVSGSEYSFTFGGGVVVGDVVSYYIVAQDNAAPPNVGANPSAGAGPFTPNPPTAVSPPTNPSTYTITATPLSGNYTVGTTMFRNITGRDITFVQSVRTVLREVVVEEPVSKFAYGSEGPTETSVHVNGTKQLVEVEEISWIPMENGQVYEGDLYVKKLENPSLQFPEGIDGVYLTITAAVADLNLRGVSAATNFLLTDATYPSETFPIIVNVTNASLPSAANPVTIRPNTGVTSVVSGLSSASQIFRILTSYITIDGSNAAGGTSRNLTIENTSTATPTVILIGSLGTTPITNVTIRNCNIINGIITSTALVVSDGNTPGSAGWFNNITIQNNSLQKALIGNFNIAVVSPGNGTGLNIVGNELNATGVNAIRYVGIYLQGIDGAAVSDNRIANFDGTSSEIDRGIWLATGTRNTVLTRNVVNSLKYLGTAGYGGHGFTVSTGTTAANITIVNNVIYDITGDGWNYASILGDNNHGMFIFTAQTGINVYYNSIHLYGNTLNRTDALSTGICLGTGTVADLRDNNIVNNLGLLGATGFGSAGIFLQTAASQLSPSNYNNIFVNPTGTGAKNVGQIAAVGYATLAAWQTATTQDANSISANPLYLANDDLRPALGSPVIGAGTPIPGITTDFLGVTRSVTNPSIGAYEQAVVVPLAPGDYTVGVSLFRTLSGKDITFEKRVRTIEVEEVLNESQVNPELWETDRAFDVSMTDIVSSKLISLDDALVTPELTGDPSVDLITMSKINSIGEPVNSMVVKRTVEQEYYVPMLNGQEYHGSLYYEFTPEQIVDNNLSSAGVYPTITAAIADAVFRGVAGPVRFILINATYPSETFPIVVNPIPGTSAANTVTLMPGVGITSLISGSPTNTQIFNFDGVDYFIIDGRSGGVGDEIKLTIENLTATGTASHTVRFINGATNNILRYVRLNNATQGTAGPRVVDFGTSAGDPAGNSFNRVENCYLSGGRTGVGFAGTAANPNSDNVIIGNTITDFGFAGVWLSSNANNTTIDKNIFSHVVGYNTSGTGVSLATSGIINIRGNIFYDLQNITTGTLRGIVGTPGAGSTVNIVNNFFSFNRDNGTKTSIYAIQITGTTEHTANIYYNTFYSGGVHTGGTAGTIVSAGLIKSNTGATSTFNAKNNVSINKRTGGTAGVVHTNFFAGGTALVGTLDINYNVWFASGDPGSFHSGWNGFVYNDQQAYRDSAAPHEQNTFFGDVQFVSATDLHIDGTSIGDPILGGTPIAGITTDIDGDTRHSSIPYRGADEVNVPFTPVAAPTSLIAVADTFFVQLTWTDNSVNEGWFVIERKDGDSASANPYVVVGTAARNSTTHTNTGLTPNTTYTYRVKAVNQFDGSGYSNQAQATTIIPVELTSFSASVIGRDVLINWSTATETNNKGFELQRKLDDEWQALGFIQGKGTTTEIQNYSFNDNFEYESFKGAISYRLKQLDYNGAYHYSHVINVDVDFTPKEYTLYQNYPNPFNPGTTIKYALPFDSNVKVRIYNLLGELVTELVNATQEVGYHNAVWNAGSMASGVYIYTIQAKSVDGQKDFKSVKKMMLVK